MEKWRPHHPLSLVQALALTGRFRMTGTARAGASRLLLDQQDVLDIVSQLAQDDFHKSMTTYADHTIWQDVYRPYTPAGHVYLKLTVTDDLLIVSFKEV
ncbi:type II toxin-antitoxin system MqsR family toxin [Tistrella mobilis]|uniref:mRNA interferase MqsR n=1 Tax=Tistrella mobilis TaxID=171437 RepID=A0A162K5G2_9PROT|nr:type II toxin-antitoxin system MqsR family toxin [Tistrella mobilis]KYO50511.1 mRNA interferase MqsR [Tistrella mobilis]